MSGVKPDLHHTDHLIRTVTSDEIKEHLKQVKYPGFSRDIVSFGLVRSAGFVDGTAKVSLALTSSDPKTPLQLKQDVEKVLRGVPGIKDIIVEISVAPAKAPPGGGDDPACRRDRVGQGRRGQEHVCRQPRLCARPSPHDQGPARPRGADGL